VKRSILPARPLRLRAGYQAKSILVIVVVAAMVAGLGAFTWYSISDVSDIRHDQAVWDRGVEATDGSLPEPAGRESGCAG
jgi:hypothetical protein